MFTRTCAAVVVFALTAALVAAQQPAPASASPDGKLRATGDGKSIKVIDVATGKEIIKIAAHKDDVTALIYSPDGKALYSADAGGVVCGIDAPTGKLLWKTEGKNKITALGLSADGKILTATAGNNTTNYNAADGRIVEKK